MNRNAMFGAICITLLIMLKSSMPQSKPTLFSSVSEQKPRPTSVRAAESNPENITKELATVNNQLGFKLFSHFFQGEQPKNVLLSPTSVTIALGMTYNGASGETKSAIAKSLALEGINPQDLNLGFEKLQTNLETDQELELTIANSLWANQGIPFKHRFLKQNRTFYRAQVTNLNFANPKAKNIINSWVKQATKDKIRHIVNSLRADDALYLVNAIYFKGNWRSQFEPSQTQTQPFHLSADFAKPHPLMSQAGTYRYYENDNFQAVSLPYQQEHLSMYIFLPSPDSDLATFSQQLTTENWQQWLQQFRLQEGSIQIPRFKLKYGVELNQALTALGMGVIFDAEQADFTEMTSQPVAINSIKHKTYVEVNEEGTEAAGVTSVGVGVTSASRAKPFEMIVNRPFFYTITDNETGTILFMGAVVNPT